MCRKRIARRSWAECGAAVEALTSTFAITALARDAGLKALVPFEGIEVAVAMEQREPISMQKVAIRPSIVLRTVYPFARSRRWFLAVEIATWNLRC